MNSFPQPEGRSYHLVFIGFLVNLLLGLTSLLAIALTLHNLLINLVVQIIMPFLLAYLLTHDFLDSLTLVTINDIFLVGASTFFRTLQVPMPRGILLALTITLFALHYQQKVANNPEENPWKISYTTACIFFYSLLFPAWLVFYSVMGQDIPRAQAFGDIQFIFPLLLYFPITRLVNRHSDVFLGWIIAVSVSMSMLGLILSLAPMDVTAEMYKNLLGELEGIKTSLAGIGIYRAPLQNTLLGFIGLFFGLFIMIDKTWSRAARLLGFGMFLLSYSVFVVKFFRGPLLSIFLVLMIYGLFALWNRKLRSVTLRLIALNLFLMVIAIASIYLIIPDYIDKMILADDLQEITGEDRVQQGEDMLAAWREAPVLGQGVGAKLKSGLIREESGLSFELSYHMLLYRLGAVGFIILMAPLLWLSTEFIRKLDFFAKIFSQLEGKFIWALLFSALAFCIAGATNPYLKTGFLVLIIVIYLALTRFVRNQESNNIKRQNVCGVLRENEA